MQKEQRRQSQLEKNSKKTLTRSHSTSDNLPVQKETSVAIKRKVKKKISTDLFKSNCKHYLNLF